MYLFYYTTTVVSPNPLPRVDRKRKHAVVFVSDCIPRQRVFRPFTKNQNHNPPPHFSPFFLRVLCVCAYIFPGA